MGKYVFIHSVLKHTSVFVLGLVCIYMIHYKDHSQTTIKSDVLMYHAGPGLFSNEGIPEDLGQSAHPERNVITVFSQ